MQLLSMQNISKRFDGIHALRDACLEVRPGEVHALVGENGAGKSTLMKILTGVHLSDSGSVELFGTPFRPRSYPQSLRAGVSMIFQDTSLFENLTVAENLLFDQLPRTYVGLLSYRKLFAKANLLLRKLEFNIESNSRVCNLAVGQRQMIEIARAIVAQGKLIIMDEPTAALNGKESETLFSRIGKLRDEGVSVIYISHRLDEVLRISDRVTVLRDGRTIATYVTRNTAQQEIIRQMVGREVQLCAARTTTDPKDRPIVLAVETLSVPGKLREVSFALKEGEILGVAGLRGVGQDHLAGALMGLEPNYIGSIRINGVYRRLNSPAQTVALGIAYVTDDRKGKGLLLEKDSAYNGTLGVIDKISRVGFLRRSLENKVAQRQTARFAITTDRPSMPVKYLSGGNQQKVVLARAVEQGPKILILNEPTAGIDVGAKEEIYKLLVNLAAQGMAIILISTDLSEITSLSHRVLVLNQKRPASLIPPELTNDASIIEAAVT